MTVGLSSEVYLLPTSNKIGDFVVISGKKRLFLKVLMAGVAARTLAWSFFICFPISVSHLQETRRKNKKERFV